MKIKMLVDIAGNDDRGRPWVVRKGESTERFSDREVKSLCHNMKAIAYSNEKPETQDRESLRVEKRVNPDAPHPDSPQVARESNALDGAGARLQRKSRK